MANSYQYKTTLTTLGAAMHPFLRQWAAREMEIDRAWAEREREAVRGRRRTGRKAVR